MRILLAAMPDTAGCFEDIVTMPSLGLCSIAAHCAVHEVRILDLVLHYRKARTAFIQCLADFRPDIVGISSMTFQYDSACTAARIVKSFNPRTGTVLGGYHATMACEEIMAEERGNVFDFLVRGEGEETFPELVRAIEAGGTGFAGIPGLSFRVNGTAVHNPRRDNLDTADIRLPARGARLRDSFTFFGIPFDTAETSRGCSFSCGFCSITGMYGRSFRPFPIGRVIDDLKSVRARGVRGVFLVDDNITLDTARFSELCDAIVSAGLNDMQYVVQASVAGIARDPGLAGSMRKANFRLVFLGIENGLDRNISSLDIEKKVNRESALRAVKLLQAAGICVLGGMITGLPDDDERAVVDTFRYGRSLGADWLAMQTLTPYPNTRIRDELLAEGLVTNRGDYGRYNGFIVNIKTRHLSARRLKWLMLREGIRLYFNPRTILNSRLFRYAKTSFLPLVKNNFKFITGGLKGSLFLSGHKWK